jgi:hypothetical protein
MYGGRMRLVKRRRPPSASVRRSFTRGALTGMVPAPTVIFRVRPLPLRTTDDRGGEGALTHHQVTDLPVLVVEENGDEELNRLRGQTFPEVGVDIVGGPEGDTRFPFRLAVATGNLEDRLELFEGAGRDSGLSKVEWVGARELPEGAVTAGDPFAGGGTDELLEKLGVGHLGGIPSDPEGHHWHSLRGFGDQWRSRSTRRPPGPRMDSSSSREKLPNSRTRPTTTPKKRRWSGSYSEAYQVQLDQGREELHLDERLRSDLFLTVKGRKSARDFLGEQFQGMSRVRIERRQTRRQPLQRHHPDRPQWVLRGHAPLRRHVAEQLCWRSSPRILHSSLRRGPHIISPSPRGGVFQDP